MSSTMRLLSPSCRSSKDDNRQSQHTFHKKSSTTMSITKTSLWWSALLLLVPPLWTTMTTHHSLLNKKEDTLAILPLNKTSVTATTRNAAAAATTTTSTQTKKTLVSGTTFAPGSLNLTKAETLQRCYVDTQTYEGQWSYNLRRHNKTCFLAVYSNDNITHHHHRRRRRRRRLVYHTMPKSGSSTLRKLMENVFDAQESLLCWPLEGDDPDGLVVKQQQQSSLTPRPLHFTFVRDPFSRFLSGYHEMVYQYLSHRNQPHKLYRNGKMPTKYKAFLNHFYTSQDLVLEQQLLRHDIKYDTNMHKSNMTWGKYQKLLDKGNYDSIHHALEQFLHDYDGQQPFDGHLETQVPRRFGLLMELLQHHDALLLDVESDVMQQFQDVIVPRLLYGDDSRSIVTVPYEKARHRGADTRGGHDLLSVKARRKICQLTAIDYCCLNYELPKVCEGVVSCRWKELPENSANGRLASNHIPPDDGLYIEAMTS